MMMMARMGVAIVAPPQTRVGTGGTVLVLVLLLLLPGRSVVLFVIDADESPHELRVSIHKKVYLHPCEIIDSEHAAQPIFVAQESESF